MWNYVNAQLNNVYIIEITVHGINRIKKRSNIDIEHYWNLKKNQQHTYRFGLIKMEYYRTNIAGGIAQHNSIDTNNIILNSATDSYASTYWNIPYTDGLSPMKQIEGRIYLNFSFKCKFCSFRW